MSPPIRQPEELPRAFSGSCIQWVARLEVGLPTLLATPTVCRRQPGCQGACQADRTMGGNPARFGSGGISKSGKPGLSLSSSGIRRRRSAWPYLLGEMRPQVRYYGRVPEFRGFASGLGVNHCREPATARTGSNAGRSRRWRSSSHAGPRLPTKPHPHGGPRRGPEERIET